MENVIFIILSVFIIYCLVQISVLLQQFLVKDAHSVRSLVVVALSGKMEDVEFVVRKYLLKYRVDRKTQIVLVDMGLDDQTRNICERFCRTHSGIIFCSNSQLNSILEANLMVKN